MIDKDLSMHGSGMTSTVIKAPATLVPYGVNTHSGQPLAAIVRAGHHAKVRLSGLGVTGPVPCTDVDEGIGVVEDASLDVSDGCGADPISQYQSAAAVVEAADGTTFTGNHLSGADIGLIDYRAVGVTISGNTMADNNVFGILVQDTDGTTKNNKITGGRVGIAAAADAQDTTVSSRGDHISGVSDSATQTFGCCGFHASVTVKP